jgi:hypothetical protein
MTTMLKLKRPTTTQWTEGQQVTAPLCAYLRDDRTNIKQTEKNEQKYLQDRKASRTFSTFGFVRHKSKHFAK